MAIETLDSKAELMRCIREELEREPLPMAAVEGLQSNLTPGAWIELNLLNGWSNFGAGAIHAAYRFLYGGQLVHVRGFLKKVAEPVNGTVVAELPAGARPKEAHSIPAGNEAGSARYQLEAGGAIIYFGTLASAVAVPLEFQFWVNG